MKEPRHLAALTDDEIESARIVEALERAHARGLNVGEAKRITVTPDGQLTKTPMCPRCARELRVMHGWQMCGFCGPIKRDT